MRKAPDPCSLGGDPSSSEAPPRRPIRSGMSYLKIGAGADAVGMGEAVVSNADGPTATYWNAGALAVSAGNPGDRRSQRVVLRRPPGVCRAHALHRWLRTSAVSFHGTWIDNLKAYGNEPADYLGTFGYYGFAAGVSGGYRLTDTWGVGVDDQLRARCDRRLQRIGHGLRFRHPGARGASASRFRRVGSPPRLFDEVRRQVVHPAKDDSGRRHLPRFRFRNRHPTPCSRSRRARSAVRTRASDWDRVPGAAGGEPARRIPQRPRHGGRELRYRLPARTDPGGLLLRSLRRGPGNPAPVGITYRRRRARRRRHGSAPRRGMSPRLPWTRNGLAARTPVLAPLSGRSSPESAAMVSAIRPAGSGSRRRRRPRAPHR